jgi:hypothetical protein
VAMHQCAKAQRNATPRFSTHHPLTGCGLASVASALGKSVGAIIVRSRWLLDLSRRPPSNLEGVPSIPPAFVRRIDLSLDFPIERGCRRFYGFTHGRCLAREILIFPQRHTKLQLSR